MTGTEDRLQLLNELVELNGRLDVLREALRAFGWDLDSELVELTHAHVLDVLARVAAGEVTSETLEEWANEMEGRDDIGLADDDICQFVFEAANPDVNGALDAAFVHRWRSTLAR